MSGSRARNSNSVSLFPFLAVLVCAMGALIFLLIVTTRQIRSEALAKAEAKRQELLKPKPEQEPTPPVIFQPQFQPAIEPAHAGRPLGVIPIEEKLEQQPGLEPERIAVIPGMVDLGESQAWPVLPPPKVYPKPKPAPEPEPIWPAAIAQKPPPPNPNRKLKAQLAELEKIRKSWQDFVQKKSQTLAQEKAKVETLTESLKKLNSQIETANSQQQNNRETQKELEQARIKLFGQLAKVKQKIEDTKRAAMGAPTKFQVVPFDGQTGTNYRPILIECTDQGMRFLPENVTLTSEDFEGFTIEKNPLLAGARALSEYWSKVSGRSGGKEPMPYVLLIVRPSGSKYFAARKLLKDLDREFGYELVEEHLPLDIPPEDPKATALCKAAVEELLRDRQDLKRLLATHGPEMLSRNPKYRVIRKPGGGFDVEYAPNGSSNGNPNGTDSGQRNGSPFGQNRMGETRPGDGRFGNDLAGQPNQFGNGTNNRTGEKSGTGQSPMGTLMPPEPSRSPNDSNQFSQNGTGENPENPGANNGTRTRDPNEPNLLPDDILRRSQNMAGSQTGADGQVGANGKPGDSPKPGQNQNQNQSGTPTEGGPAREPVAEGGSDQLPEEQALSSANPQNLGSPQKVPAGAAKSGTASSGDPQTGPPSNPYAPAMPNFMRLNQSRSMRRAEPYQRRWGLSESRASIGFEREVTIKIEDQRLVVGNAFAVAFNEKTTKEQLAAGMLEAIELTARKWGRPPASFYWVPTLQFQVKETQVPVYRDLATTSKAWGLESNATSYK